MDDLTKSNSETLRLFMNHSLKRKHSMPPVHSSDITAELSNKMLTAAITKSDGLGLRMNIAIVDAGANLKAFHRMDGAWLGSVDIACKKARTARFFDMPTGEIGQLSQPGGTLYNIENTNGGLISFPGGLPITNDQGTVIGAIGVSGASVEEDHAVASAGLDAAIGAVN